MKKVIKEYQVVFTNGLQRVIKCETILQAFCEATLTAINNGQDTTVHHIIYDREYVKPEILFNHQ